MSRCGKPCKPTSKTEEARSLSGARKRFLEKTIDNFRRHGAELDAAGKARIAEIDVELSKLTIRFSENVLDSTNEFELVITDESKLAGLPESAVAMARDSATSKGLDAPSWRFTLQAPSYVALMTYLDDGEIRRHVYEAYVNRALRGERDNRPVIQRILELRREKANLLGYRDFADLVLEDRMAHTGDRAQAVSRRSESQNGCAISEKENSRATRLRRPRRTGALGHRLLSPKNSAPRSMTSMKKPCAPTSRSKA